MRPPAVLARLSLRPPGQPVRGRPGSGGRPGRAFRFARVNLPPPAANQVRPAGGEPDTTLAPTVALTALTLSVALGFGRLFADAGFLVPVVVSALATHTAAWACRRRGLRTAAAGAVSLATTALVATWTVLGSATAFGLPTPGTLRRGAEVLSAAAASFDDVVAPAPVLPGFVLATVLAVGVTAFMADWAAFRISATFEPCIPAFTLFLFTAALGSERHRAWAVAIFVAAGAMFVLVHELRLPGRMGSWFGSSAGPGPATLMRTGAVLAALALGVGLVTGPRLPGAGEAPVVSYKNKQGGGASDRATVSPLVDIRGRLVSRSGVEVFTVKSTARAYWRLTSLDSFDGAIWSSDDTYKRARGPLASDVPLVPAGGTELVQDFQIGALGSIWLPAAYRPWQVSGLGGVSYNAGTGSLITSRDVTDGVRYRVRSTQADLSGAELSQVADDMPPEVAQRYLDLPRQSRAVVIEAQRIVRGATTPYQKAKALQDHFQANFTYDLTARQGHDGRAVENFLLSSRRGYCEQFAGTYTVLARLVGLPARVAVGFTPGELQADGRYHVRDEHAHAWPEVYLQGYGWVAFEPTPGRGAPGAEDYTGLPEAQDTSGAATTPTTAPPVPTTVPADQQAPQSSPEDAGEDQSLVGIGAGQGRGASPPYLLIAGAAAVAAAIVWAVAAPLLRRCRRQRRRARATTASARVLAAWEEAEEALSVAGVARRPAETLVEYALRAPRFAGLDGDTAGSLRRLAAAASAACYAGGQAEAHASAAEEGAATARRVERLLAEQAGWARRLWRSLDPRLVRGARQGSPRRHRDPGAGAGDQQAA